MRRTPLLLFPLLLALGCGRASEGMADTSSPGSMSAMAKSRMVGGVTAAYAGAVTATEASKTGGPGAAAAQEQSAANEEAVPVSRMVVRNGELSLEVKDIRIAETQVRNVAQSMGGTVDASQGTDLAGPTPSLSMTIRVPESRFEKTVANLENLGTRQGKSISSEDVTTQAVDMDARVKSLRVQESAYRAILAGTRRISDVLEVQEKLMGVRTQIEQIVAQRAALGDQAARSTINVNLAQVRPVVPFAPATPQPGWFATTWREATGSLIAIVQGLATLVLWVVVLLPVWLPLALLARFAWRRTRTAPTA